MAREVGDVMASHRYRCATLCAALSFAGVVLLPSRAEARGCREVSDIVSEQRCSQFGVPWSLEGTLPITFNFGMRYSEVSTSDLTFTQDVGKQSRLKGYKPYRYQGDALGLKSLSGLGVEGGFGFYIHGQLYMRLEGALTFGSASTSSLRTESGVNLLKDDGLNVSILHGGAPIGYRIALGRAALRGEVMLGFVSTTVYPRVERLELPSSVSASAVRGLVEPRIAGDIWFTQHISFGAYGGTNLLDPDGQGRAFGLSLTWHNRAYDGDTSS